MNQIIIPERFLNYLYHTFKTIADPDQHRVKIILRDGRKLRNILVWNGCVLLIEKDVRFASSDIEILQLDLDAVTVTAKNNYKS